MVNHYNNGPTFNIIITLITCFNVFVKSYLPTSQINALNDLYVSLNVAQWPLAGYCPWNLTQLAVNNTLPEFYCGLDIVSLGNNSHTVDGIGLNLMYIQLNGTIPPSIFELQDLTKIEMWYAMGLTGTIPNTICNLSLDTIGLSHTSLYGNIPECIGDMTSLTSLTLHHIPSLSIHDYVVEMLCYNAKNMSLLYLSYVNYIGSIPDCIGELDKLWMIIFNTLENLNSTIPQSVSKLTQISVLYLSNLPNLHGVFPSNILKNNNLMELTISNTSLSGNISIYDLCNNTNLISLQITKSNLSFSIPKCIKQLTKLHSLVLDGVSVYGILPDEICYLNDLITLSITTTSMHGTIASCITHNLTAFEYVSLSSNNFDGEFPSILSSDLYIFDIHNNSFTGSLSTIFPLDAYPNLKIVALHSSDDNYYAPIRLKYLLQTVSVYESKPIYYANKKKLLSVVAKEIIQDIKLLSGTSKLQIQIPFARVILDEGFVTNLTKNPNWNASIRLPPNGDYTLLFRGRPPVQLVINDMTVNCIHDNIESNKRDYSYDSVLAMIQQMVSDLKIAVLAKRDVNAAIKIIRYIISVIKGQCLKINMYDEKMTVQERIGKMKRNKQLISDLETVMNDIIFIVDYSKSKENVTKKIEWIYKIKKMKFGQKSMKRAKKYRDEELNANNILNELLIIKQQYHLSNDNEGEGQEYHDDEYKQDEGAGVSDVTKLYTIIKSESSKRTSWSHLLDIFESLDLLLADVNDDIINTDLNLVDLLYCLGIVGIGIRVGRIEASNIDPWQLKIKYVSHCYNDSVSAMCALDSALDTFEIDKKHIITKIKDKNCDKIINENKEEMKSEEEYIPDVMM
eukprot:459144_1